MGGDCTVCSTINVDRIHELVVVGGNHDPYDTPWGEIRACPRCDALFCYTRDHDNEIGYVAAPPRLHRLDDGAAQTMLEDATVVATRQLAYFATLEDDYSRAVADGYRAELDRLRRYRG